MAVVACCVCSILAGIELLIVFSVIDKYIAKSKEYECLLNKYENLEASYITTKDAMEIIKYERDCYRKRLEDYEHYII